MPSETRFGRCGNYLLQGSDATCTLRPWPASRVIWQSSECASGSTMPVACISSAMAMVVVSLRVVTRAWYSGAGVESDSWQQCTLTPLMRTDAVFSCAQSCEKIISGTMINTANDSVRSGVLQ